MAPGEKPPVYVDHGISAGSVTHRNEINSRESRLRSEVRGKHDSSRAASNTNSDEKIGYSMRRERSQQNLQYPTLMKPLGPNNELHLPIIEVPKPVQLSKDDLIRLKAK